MRVGWSFTLSRVRFATYIDGAIDLLYRMRMLHVEQANTVKMTEDEMIRLLKGS
jgi:hypothetical protein